MPDFSALGTLFSKIASALGAFSGFAGSVANPLPPFLTKKG